MFFLTAFSADLHFCTDQHCANNWNRIVKYSLVFITHTHKIKRYIPSQGFDVLLTIDGKTMRLLFVHFFLLPLCHFLFFLNIYQILKINDKIITWRKENIMHYILSRFAYFDSFARLWFMWIEFDGYTERIEFKKCTFYVYRCAK